MDAKTTTRILIRLANLFGDQAEAQGLAQKRAAARFQGAVDIAHMALGQQTPFAVEMAFIDAVGAFGPRPAFTTYNTERKVWLASVLMFTAAQMGVEIESTEETV